MILALVCVALQAGVLPLPVTAAESSLGISGSFPDQVFEIPLGGSVSGPSIDVRVFNNSGDEMAITMKTISPEGVTVSLEPGYSFTLQPQSQLPLLVRVDVSTLAQLGGPREISVIAESTRTPAGGVAVQESARLNSAITVVGDSGTVIARTVSPAGDPVVAQVRLFRTISGTNYEIAYSDNGTVQALVSPGTYVAFAYKNGELLAQSDPFTVAKDERVDVPLEVRTVYFQGFGVQAENLESGEISQARVTYTVVNLEREMAKGEVRLSVTLGGALVDTVPILNVDPLPLGRVGAPYLYAPAEGWKEGTYGFSLQLYAEGELKAETLEQTLKLGGGGISGSWLWIIFVILGVVGAAVLGFLIFFLLKRRKKEEEKPRRVEKKGKEEKPARKGEEPARKPEPVRPAAPPPIEEPTAEPAPLASISSLKARMASMGRDQGTGKPAEEEPGAEEEPKSTETGPEARVHGPVSPLPRAEPQRPAAGKVEEKPQKPPVVDKPAGQKPGVYSKVTATGKHEPPKPPTAQGPAPTKPDGGVQINWPPKAVESPKPPGGVQINWPPKPAEPAKPAEPPKPPSGLAELARQRMEAQQKAAAPEEAAPAEEGAGEEPAEPEAPPSRSSFAEAARLRMEARQRPPEAGQPGAGPEEPPTEGDASGEPGEGEERPPNP